MEPSNELKIKMIAGHVVSQGSCIDMGNANLETKFEHDGTQVRFMRNDAGEYTSIAVENETLNVYAYWSEGYDVLTMLSQDGQEFNRLFSQIQDELGICF